MKHRCTATRANSWCGDIHRARRSAEEFVNLWTAQRQLALAPQEGDGDVIFGKNLLRQYLEVFLAKFFSADFLLKRIDERQEYGSIIPDSPERKRLFSSIQFNSDYLTEYIRGIGLNIWVPQLEDNFGRPRRVFRDYRRLDDPLGMEESTWLWKQRGASERPPRPDVMWHKVSHHPYFAITEYLQRFEFDTIISYLAQREQHLHSEMTLAFFFPAAGEQEVKDDGFHIVVPEELLSAFDDQDDAVLEFYQALTSFDKNLNLTPDKEFQGVNQYGTHVRFFKEAAADGGPVYRYFKRILPNCFAANDSNPESRESSVLEAIERHLESRGQLQAARDIAQRFHNEVFGVEDVKLETEVRPGEVALMLFVLRRFYMMTPESRYFYIVPLFHTAPYSSGSRQRTLSTVALTSTEHLPYDLLDCLCTVFHLLTSPIQLGALARQRDLDRDAFQMKRYWLLIHELRRDMGQFQRSVDLYTKVIELVDQEGSRNPSIIRALGDRKTLTRHKNFLNNALIVLTQEIGDLVEEAADKIKEKHCFLQQMLRHLWIKISFRVFKDNVRITPVRKNYKLRCFSTTVVSTLYELIKNAHNAPKNRSDYLVSISFKRIIKGSAPYLRFTVEDNCGGCNWSETPLRGLRFHQEVWAKLGNSKLEWRNWPSDDKPEGVRTILDVPMDE